MLLPNLKIKPKKEGAKDPKDYTYEFDAESDEDAIKKAEALIQALEADEKDED